jgi:2-amino-4-hydroxy-6-hydroxymethyldihydropteridine diphosphokinase
MPDLEPRTSNLEPHLAAIALGSNLSSARGAPDAALREAITRVARLGALRAVSTFHETAPVGHLDQPNFRNAALLLETELGPAELMAALLEIERAMGRDRAAAPPKGPRIIDLDLLLMDDLVLATPDLTLPHPAMAERRFVLEPLAEIAPGMRDPLSGRTVAKMLARLDADFRPT